MNMNTNNMKIIVEINENINKSMNTNVSRNIKNKQI